MNILKRFKITDNTPQKNLEISTNHINSFRLKNQYCFLEKFFKKIIQKEQYSLQ